MAAKAKSSTATFFLKKPKVKRPGVHAKTKQSKNKNSKNYIKPYVAQGH
jgi:hypothetical protein